MVRPRKVYNDFDVKHVDILSNLNILIKLIIQRGVLPSVNASRIIPCCTKFRWRLNDTSTIHYSHIINRQAGGPGLNASRLFKIHYASWFYLVGDFDRARQLVNNEPMTEIPLEGDIYSYNDKLEVYWVESIRVNTEALGNQIFFGFERWHPRQYFSCYEAILTNIGRYFRNRLFSIYSRLGFKLSWVLSSIEDSKYQYRIPFRLVNYSVVTSYHPSVWLT